jgi:hypothetical protein
MQPLSEFERMVCGRSRSALGKESALKPLVRVLTLPPFLLDQNLDQEANRLLCLPLAFEPHQSDSRHFLWDSNTPTALDMLGKP